MGKRERKGQEVSQEVKVWRMRNENSHCAKPLTPIGGTPTRLELRCSVSWSLVQDKGSEKRERGVKVGTLFTYRCSCPLYQSCRRSRL